MIQFCSRTERIDGLLTIKDARRCSDVDDPARAIQDLLDAGLLEPVAGRLRLVEIHDHIPPPSVRLASEKAKIRKQRQRAHEAGDHSMCLPDHCSHASVTSDVTRDPGTGQDGTGRPKGEGSSEQKIDLMTGEVFTAIPGCDHPLTTAVEVQRDMCNRCWTKADGAKKMAASGWAI